MKKPAWLLATALIVAMSFTACGPKNTDTVSKDDNTPVVSESTEKSSDKITSEDIAKVVKFLALDTDYVTGQAIEVAGGLMI